MYNGYFGKVLRIDVSNKTFCEELIDSKLYRILMGGSCLAAYFFIKEQKYHVDPFSEDNLLILATGPVSGSHSIDNVKIPRHRWIARIAHAGING